MEAFHINNHRTFRKEFIGKQESLIEITSVVVPKIDYEIFHSKSLELVRSLLEVLVCGA